MPTDLINDLITYRMLQLSELTAIVPSWSCLFKKKIIIQKKTKRYFIYYLFITASVESTVEIFVVYF